jgi:hypothetical protein
LEKKNLPFWRNMPQPLLGLSTEDRGSTFFWNVSITTHKMALSIFISIPDASFVLRYRLHKVAEFLEFCPPPSDWG